MGVKGVVGLVRWGPVLLVLSRLSWVLRLVTN